MIPISLDSCLESLDRNIDQIANVMGLVVGMYRIGLINDGDMKEIIAAQEESKKVLGVFVDNLAELEGMSEGDPPETLLPVIENLFKSMAEICGMFGPAVSESEEFKNLKETLSSLKELYKK